MKLIKVLAGCAVVGVLVALTYFAFEYSVHHAINFIWLELFNTDTNRLMILPLAMSLTIIFFGLQHKLDPKSEVKESHGLGGKLSDVSLRAYSITLFIGFFSLVAGASLGPEAVLVPASTILGAWVAKKLIKDTSDVQKLYAAAGIMALFSAFFHSFLVGLISIFLVKKQTSAKINRILVLVAITSAGASTITLNVIDPADSYFNFPDLTLKLALADLLFGITLFLFGYASTFILKYMHDKLDTLKTTTWWKQALLASTGLSIIYWLGGPLVQFTGNQSIQPLISQATTLGYLGLIWIFITKLAAIAWSKTMGYRGGLIFPMVFVASVCVAIMQSMFTELNFGIALLFTIAGIIFAEKKAKILL